MIGGLARLGKWFIDSGVRRGTPHPDRENVLTVFGSLDPWKQRLGFEAPDAAYPILLDQRGIVRWRHAGSLEEKVYRALSNQLLALLEKQL